MLGYSPCPMTPPGQEPSAQCMLGYTPSYQVTPHWTDTPHAQCMLQYIPSAQCMLGYTHPLPNACWDTPPLPRRYYGIRSTSERYASYWNAFLLLYIFAFSGNGEAYWRQYDWTRVTTICKFGEIDPQMVCYAHNKGVRVTYGGTRSFTT